MVVDTTLHAYLTDRFNEGVSTTPLQEELLSNTNAEDQLLDSHNHVCWKYVILPARLVSAATSVQSKVNPIST